MLTMLPSTVIGLAILGLLLANEVLQRRRRAQHLPPGPQSLAQAVARVGPKAPQWVIFNALQDDYGESELCNRYRGTEHGLN